MYKFHLKTFPNGLRILMVPSKESLSFQVMVLVNTGADFETKEINGISHFLEHMCFKGTKKRKTNLDIAKELDSIGGAYNAFTGRENTGYYVRVAKEHKELAIDIVSDIYLNSQFSESEMQKEKGVIIEEMNMYHDDPQRYIWDLWDKLLYGDQPAGWSIIGFKENIQKMNRNDFLEYYRNQYRSRSTLVVVSGNFSQNVVTRLVKNYFRDIAKGSTNSKKRIKESQKTPQVFLEHRPTDQTNLILGVRGINLFDKRRYALEVLDSVLDGGMSARLWQLVKEKLGAAYDIHSNIEHKTDVGYWAVSAGIDSNRLEIIIKAIMNELEKFRIELIGKEEIKKAKDCIAGHLALGLENVHNVASRYGYQLLLKKKIETPQEYLKSIKKVTAYDLRKVAQDLLIPQHLNLILISPYKNKEKLVKLLKNNF